MLYVYITKIILFQFPICSYKKKTYLPSLLNAGRNNKWRTCILIGHSRSLKLLAKRRADLFIQEPHCTPILDTQYHACDSWANDVCVTSISLTLAVCHQSHSNSVETARRVRQNWIFHIPVAPAARPLFMKRFVSACVKVALIQRAGFFGRSDGRSQLWMSHAALSKCLKVDQELPH